MPHKMDWYIPDRIVYELVWGEQTLKEIQETAAKYNALACSGCRPVHLIVNAQNLKTMPLNMASLRESLSPLRHPSRGWIVYIDSPQPMLNFLAEVLAQRLYLQFRHKPCLEDALDFLRQQDPSINWNSANDSVMISKE